MARLDSPFSALIAVDIGTQGADKLLGMPPDKNRAIVL